MSYNNLSCLTCRIIFKEADDQRLHYKLEWHRYNLKRKMIDLPPVDLETFCNKLIKQEDINPHQFYCKLCNKLFYSENSYDAHKKSKKHMNASNSLTKKDIECNKEIVDINKNTIDSLQIEANLDSNNESSWETLSSNSDATNDDNKSAPIVNKNLTCLFCEKNSSIISNIDEDLMHMNENHSFFIPYFDKVVDMKGYLQYLDYKIKVCNTCIWCHKKFASTLNCQRHINDKGHSKVKFDPEDAISIEYLQFYTKKNIKNIVQDGDKLKRLIDNVFGISYNILKNISDSKDESYITQEDIFQLALPNGLLLGHRSLNVYYKQRIVNNSRALDIRRKQKSIINTAKLFSSSNLNQWNLNINTANAKQTKLSKWDIRRDKRYFLIPYKNYHKKALSIMLRANSQRHFRQQVDF
ncbi:unnamed protein product [Gordionus sp. m RMFG-2023]|uniref:cytoplasmic 60S subunit biogenesis factor ZNF622-like n=1 Tax=Gordionus sp. m RMFG-2023 TaxID=3053472 RepID=UPI0030DFDECD